MNFTGVLLPKENKTEVWYEGISYKLRFFP